MKMLEKFGQLVIQGFNLDSIKFILRSIWLKKCLFFVVWADIYCFSLGQGDLFKKNIQLL